MSALSAAPALPSPSSSAPPSAPPPGAVWTSHASSAQFCPRCGTLLALVPSAGAVACGPCGWTQPLAALPRLLAPVFTRSTAKPEHAWLAEARAAAAGGGDDLGLARGAEHARATVAEECPNPACRAPTMRFYTMQLRSADEGQTCFYDCEKCGYKFSVNT